MINSTLRTNEELTRIYRLYADTVYRVCYIILKNTSDAEDAVQNCFVKFMNENKEFYSDEHIKAWLIRTAKNDSINMQRHWFKAKRSDGEKELSYSDEYDSGLMKQIFSLNHKYSVPIYLFYYEGYTTIEIARILKINHSTLRSHLARGREKLKSVLEEDCYE